MFSILAFGYREISPKEQLWYVVSFTFPSKLGIYSFQQFVKIKNKKNHSVSRLDETLLISM